MRTAIDVMRAAVVERYGSPDVVRISEVPVPSPRADEVLVRVHAAAVTAGDARIRAARFPSGFAPFARLAFGVRRPRRRILGSVLSGEVAAVGTETGGFSIGGEVCGMTGIGMGAHAEFVSVAAGKLVPKPATASHQDAAAVLFGGTTAWYFLHDLASVQPGDSVLVNGASGAVGSNAVQLARHLGATVTAVTSAPNLALARDLGANEAVDYRSTPVDALTERFDVVLDAVGNLSASSGRRLLTERGVLLLVVAGLWETIGSRGNVRSGSAPERAADFEFLLQLLADGRLRAVIDSVHSLDEITAAYRRVDSGRKIGNVLVRP